jgi:putative toxin-antitoxin system antitoxin component (TIGR02293 family)
LADKLLPDGREVRDVTKSSAAASIARETPPGAHSYARLLGLRVSEGSDLVERVEAGFSYAAFESLRRNLGLPIEELARIAQIPLRTLARRRVSGRFSKEESDRLLRTSRVFSRALALFESDLARARAWLETPARALGGRAPRDLATTDAGAHEVEDLIGRLEHGVFS